MDKILEGDLASFEVPDLLRLLGTGEQTGVLVLERPDCEAKLFFRGGRPVFAASTAEELRLGSLVVRSRKLSPAALERLMRRHRGGLRLGQVLLSEKVLTEEELAGFLKVQVSEIIFHAFGWREGVFTFFGGVPPPAGAITLEMDLDNLVVEGLRRIRVRRPDEVLPDRSMVVEPLVNPERVKHSVTLTQEEWRVFFLADGRRSVDEICRLAGQRDKEGTLEVLQHLRAARLLGLRSAPAPEPAAAAPAASASGVEFMAPLPARRPKEDDTKEIVDKKAVRYLGDAPRLTVGRLILTVDGAETSFPLNRDTYTLGRHRNNDIVISDPKASAFHARIDRTPEGFVLVDLHSRNGSWVNGKRVESALLKTGDQLRLGMAQLVYKVEFTSGA